MTARSGYAHLVDRLNQFPQGAPPSELLFNILSLLFSEQEAQLVSQLPSDVYSRAGRSRVEDARRRRASRARRVGDAGLLLDLEQGGTQWYVLLHRWRVLRVLVDAGA